MHKRKSKFILVAIDHYTKWIETAIISSKDANSTAKLIKELIIEKHGVPNRILSYYGLEFNNSVIRELATKYGINCEFGSPNHHQTVGVIERTNQTLIYKLKKLSEFSETSWERALKRQHWR